MKHFFGLTVAVMLAFGASAQPYHVSERITIEVEYWAVLWPNTAVGKVVCEVSDDGGVVKIAANATLSGLFGWMYKLNDTYTSWVNPADGFPIKASSNLKEGSWRFASSYKFNRSAGSVDVSYRRGDAPEFTHKTVSAPSNIMDGVALFYWLRSQPSNFLAAGETKTVPVMLEDAVRHIQINFLGIETRKINGSMTTALKYSCQVFKKGSTAELMNKPFYVWLSNDEKRLPLMMESPIRIGNVRATLISVEMSAIR